jgi:hypothetical protein
MKIIFTSIALYAAIGLSGVVVHAAPFSFTYSNHITDSPKFGPLIPGVAVGDLIALNVIVDNGNNALNGQTWLSTDVISATISVGSYTASFDAPIGGQYDFAYDYTFQTDSNGFISSVRYYDNYGNNSDIYGVGGQLGIFTNGIRDFNGLFAGWNDSGSLFDPGLWADSFGHRAPIPEPQTYALLLFGLVLLYFVKLRLGGR